MNRLKKNQIVSILATGANVSSKSIPSIWAYPLHTNLALFLVTCPSSFNLFMKTHFVQITFLFFGLGTNSQVSFFSIWSNYSSMALFQNSSSLASSKQVSSIVDESARCVCSSEQILLLVSTLASLFPIIWFEGWFFYTRLLGVFGGTCWTFSYASIGSSSSSPSTSFSSSFDSGLPVSSIVTLILSTTLFNLIL